MARKKKKKPRKKKKVAVHVPPWSPLAEMRVSAGLVLPAEPNMIELEHYTIETFGKNAVDVYIYEYGDKREYYFVEPWEDGTDKEYVRARSVLEYSTDLRARSIEDLVNKVINETVSNPRLRRTVSYYLLRDIVYYGIYTVLFFDDEIIRFVVEPRSVKIKHKKYGVLTLGVKTTLSDYRQLVEKLVLRFGRERVVVAENFVASIGWGTAVGEAELPNHISFTKMFWKPEARISAVADKLRGLLEDKEVILVCGPWAYDYASLIYSLVSSSHVVSVETATLPIPVRIRYRPEDVGVMLSAEQPDYVFVHPPDAGIAASASMLGIGVVMVSLAKLERLQHLLARLPAVTVVCAETRGRVRIEYYVEGEKTGSEEVEE